MLDHYYPHIAYPHTTHYATRLQSGELETLLVCGALLGERTDCHYIQGHIGASPFLLFFGIRSAFWTSLISPAQMRGPKEQQVTHPAMTADRPWPFADRPDRRRSGIVDGPVSAGAGPKCMIAHVRAGRLCYLDTWDIWRQQEERRQGTDDFPCHTILAQLDQFETGLTVLIGRSLVASVVRAVNM